MSTFNDPARIRNTEFAKTFFFRQLIQSQKSSRFWIIGECSTILFPLFQPERRSLFGFPYPSKVLHLERGRLFWFSRNADRLASKVTNESNVNHNEDL